MVLYFSGAIGSHNEKCRVAEGLYNLLTKLWVIILYAQWPVLRSGNRDDVSGDIDALIDERVHYTAQYSTGHSPFYRNWFRENRIKAWWDMWAWRPARSPGCFGPYPPGTPTPNNPWIRVHFYRLDQFVFDPGNERYKRHAVSLECLDQDHVIKTCWGSVYWPLLKEQARPHRGLSWRKFSHHLQLCWSRRAWTPQTKRTLKTSGRQTGTRIHYPWDMPMKITRRDTDPEINIRAVRVIASCQKSRYALPPRFRPVQRCGKCAFSFHIIYDAMVD